MSHYQENQVNPIWILAAGGAAITALALVWARTASAAPPARALPRPEPSPKLPGPPSTSKPPSPPLPPGEPLPPVFEVPPSEDWDETRPQWFVNFQTLGVKDLNLADYPWEQPLIHVQNYPTPNFFYVVQPTDDLDLIVKRALGSALAMAGRTDLVTKMEESWADGLKSQMREAILCGHWNDTLYGQTDPSKAGGASRMNIEGRGLNFTNSHADLIARLSSGMLPVRTTDLEGRYYPEFGDIRHPMTLYIPAPNLDALGQPGIPQDLVFDLSWSDGSSTINPPPNVDIIGILVPFDFDGGCAGWSQ